MMFDRSFGQIKSFPGNFYLQKKTSRIKIKTKQQSMKKVLFLTIFLTIVAFAAFLNFEPTVGSAAFQATSTVALTVTSEISLTGCGGETINMSPNLDLTYNSAVGTSTACNVKSNKGYYLYIKATSTPALVSWPGAAYSFMDYSTTSRSAWSTGVATDYKFGFTAYGNDVQDPIWGSHESCGAGGTPNDVTNSGAYYAGLISTGNGTTTADRASATDAAGVNTTICFGAAKNASAAVESGNYRATVVFTAVQKP